MRLRLLAPTSKKISAGSRLSNTAENHMEVNEASLSFLTFTHQVPHMLLLDEPTNHLDMETIDALAEAINGFEGGVVLVSHDFRLIDQVADQIWICEKETVTKWEGDILSYKNHLKSKVMKASNKDAKSK